MYRESDDQDIGDPGDDGGPDARDDADRPRGSGAGWAFVAIVLVAAACWLRFGPGLFARPIQMGSPMPPTRLESLHATGSRLLLGVEGQVLWLVLLTTDSPEASPLLPELEPVWRRLRTGGRFALAVAAVAPDAPDQARAALEGYRDTLPLYLAGREVPRSFGIDPEGEPWHFLIDARGRVAAMARGSNPTTVDRLARMVDDWIDDLAPASEIRFRLTQAGVRPFGDRIAF